MIRAIYLVLLLIVVSTHSLNSRHSGQDLEELERFINHQQAYINPRYRQHYHVSAPVGWINDPNGFSFYRGEYHLFYQFYPYEPVWGPMHWGHVKSKDMVNWERLPTALLPGEEQCFSGSALVVNDTLMLMYTAHFIRSDYSEYQSQYLAIGERRGVFFKKYENNPVLDAPERQPDFRDPKVWKHGDFYYMVIGSKNDRKLGAVLLYRSPDLINWTFLRVMGESDGWMGYMWECPDFFELDGKFVLLMSPQGIEPNGDRFKNVFQTGYIIGDFDYTTYEFSPDGEFKELDFGHDFYAAQTTEANGRRYLVSWFNMWEREFPEATDGWAGTMTIVRELKLSGDTILMKPVEAMVDLREDKLEVGEWKVGDVIRSNKAAEIIIEGISIEHDVELLLTGDQGGETVSIKWNHSTWKAAVVRGISDDRQVFWSPVGKGTWRIFLDSSSIEVFCGEGEVVFSSRVFPDGGTWKITNLSGQNLQATVYSLRRSVPP